MKRRLILLMGLIYGLLTSCEKNDDNSLEKVPVLSTKEVTKITTNSATSGGNITDDGGTSIIVYGVCWCTTENPTIDDNKTEDGIGAGSFSSSITDLEPNTTYYVRAYATNSTGIAYGNVISFKTPTQATVPVVSTTEVTEITTNTATSGGNITDVGGTTVTTRGICWSTNENPTINDNITEDGTGTGIFASSITNLKPNTTYFIRAYATNSAGTGYGSPLSFTTKEEIILSTFTDSRDDKVYKTVVIGNQEWMAENLAYLPGVAGPGTGSETMPYYYVHGYDGTDVDAAKANPNYTTYGVLYNWPAAMNSASGSSSNPSGVQGVCPTGWHLPSDAEWTELTDYMGGKSDKLKATGVLWPYPNGATNETGFTALPGGYRSTNGDFSIIGYTGNWWSATEFGISGAGAYNHFITDSDKDVIRTFLNKENGFSIRCVKD